MKKIFLSLSFAIFICVTAMAQSIELYPTNWWVDMKWNEVQILVRSSGDQFNQQEVSIDYPGVELKKIHRLDNPHYFALDLLIAADAKPGIVKIKFGEKRKAKTVDWPLKARRAGNGSAFAQGVHSSDLVYLIMPDRFSNGDYSNDKIAGLKDQSLNRDSMYHRHGGDLLGIQNHLNYLQDLGVTTIWMTPVLQNDMPTRTEHGYAITNHYKVEPRLGGNDAYKNLSDAIHARGMKLIQDAVYNHIGLHHFTVNDKPTKDWLHEWPEFTQTTYKDQTLFDPYAAASEVKQVSDGWFVRDMPDLNHNNPYVSNYLIQHALWSVEEFGVDGWRIDTYVYNDLEFMNKCNQALYDEYPSLTLFGETWVHGVINQSYFCENNLDVPFKSNLQNTTDFQTLFYGIQPAVNEKFGWTEGVNKLYTTAAQDILYKNPEQQVIFLDNHDLPRFYSVVGEDTAKYKTALTWLLTFRGVPQMYYGMETLMTGFTNPDGHVRSDFKGGWKEDSLNKFTAAGRTEKENAIFNHIRTLAKYRQTASAITKGKMMQYIPQDGLYVYFRYDDDQTIMCVMNTAEKEKTIDIHNSYTERTKGYNGGFEIVESRELGPKFNIPAKTMWVVELKK